MIIIIDKKKMELKNWLQRNVKIVRSYVFNQRFTDESNFSIK